MKQDKRVIEWGFDLTEFPNVNVFKQLLKKHKLKNGKKYRGQSGFQWRNPHLRLITANNAITGQYYLSKTRGRETGYASYIGIRGHKPEVLRLKRDIKKKAKYIKGVPPFEQDYGGESKYRRDFI